MQVYFVLEIIERKDAAKLLAMHKEMNLSLVLANLGRGTATYEHLSLYDLEPSEKAVIGTVASRETMRNLFRRARQDFYIDIPGRGIIAAIPIKSVGGQQTLAYLTQDQTVGGGKPDMKFEYELIVVVFNEGYSDAVMDAARSAGASGGTLVHAKGAGRAKKEKFFDVSLAEEKDMLYIVAESENKAAIMKAINEKCGDDTAVGAICFSLPVSQVEGLRRREAE